MRIIGREEEQLELQRLLSSKKAEFLAIYGRRRIGKTYLIENFFKERGIFFHITGSPKETTKNQLWNYSEIFSDIFNNGNPIRCPDSWKEAFGLLRRSIETNATNEKIILFFDELPWLATQKSGFISALSYLWNRHLVSDPRIILIVCGSAASWMIKHVIHEQGGLYNRLTHQMRLLPFNLGETETYLREIGISLDRKQIIEIFMALGGIPTYLNLIRPGQSSAQAIGTICFSKENDSLYGEFNNIFRSLFKNSTNHMRVIKILSTNKTGMSRQQLMKVAGISSGSIQEKVTRELIESGFIAETKQFGKSKKGSHLRLIDEYSNFFLKWKNEMKNTRTEGQSDTWLKIQNSRAWESWAGFAFEGICQNHIHQIARALGISGIDYSASCFHHHPKGEKVQGAQIDLVIDRADKCINICEMKFSNDVFSISKAYMENLINKRKTFQIITGTKKTIFLTFITPHGVTKNESYHQVVTNELTINDLF